MDSDKLLAAIGFLIPFIGFVFPYSASEALLLLAVSVVTHEALHYVVARALRVSVKKVVFERNSVVMLIESDSRSKIVIVALAPQLVTVFLAYLAVCGVAAAVPVALAHVTMSAKDIKVALRYLSVYIR